MLTRFARARRTLNRTALSWAIWLTTMGLAAYLWTDVGQRAPIIGFAQSIEHRVSTVTPGRIQAMTFRLGDQVVAGQVVATLDPAHLTADIQIEKARLKHLDATIVAAASKERLQQLSTARGFEQARDGARAALSNAQAQLRIKSAALQALTVRRKDLKELFRKRLVVKQDLESVEVRYPELRKEVESARTAVRLMRRQLESASARRGALPRRNVELSVAQLKAEAVVVRRQLDRLKALRKGLSLRAPCDGHVSAVFMRSGEVAKIGDPVLSILGHTTNRVTACVAEGQATSLEVGAKATLFSRGMKHEKLEGRVVALSPVVQELPIRCRPKPRQPTWGRSMVIEIEKTRQALVAGQGFNVRLHEGEQIMLPRRAIAAPRRRVEARSVGASSAVASPAAEGRYRKLGLDPTMLLRTRFEPSGLQWVASLSRFVVVSDDTGFEDVNEHAPWIFLMSREGVVDPQMHVVKGAKHFNDLESIAAGAKDSLYLLSSQSYSKKGKRKSSRQGFHKLVLEGGRYQVAGHVRLAELLDDAGSRMLSTLGIASTRRLNIEGMTTHRSGGLLLGLKAPVDGQDQALIWKMEEPDALLSKGRLPAGKLTLWGKVKLDVQANGQQAVGGISELLELPDGGLLIAATASGIKTKTQSGSLWYAPRPNERDAKGALRASRLRTFRGKKPEGLALSPRAGHFIVIFDEGKKTPSWLELPCPKR